MLSICVCLKNRSRVFIANGPGKNKTINIFYNNVRSINDSVKKMSFKYKPELVVADFNSDDWPLKEWIHEECKHIDVVVINVDKPFSRGYGRNVAAEYAHFDNMFFLDADMTVCKDVLELGLAVLHKGKAFAPISMQWLDPLHTKKQWFDPAGKGNIFVKKDWWRKVGGWPEYDDWGSEDKQFYAKIEKMVDVHRKRVDCFFHQWHPRFIEWKNRYATKRV